MARAHAVGTETRAGVVPPSRDWVVRAYEALPLPPAWTGLGVALLYLLAGFGYGEIVSTLSGRASPWLENLWAEPVNAAIVAYLLTALVYARRGMSRDLRSVRSRLRCTDEEFEANLRATVSPSQAALRTASLLAVVSGLALVTLDPKVRMGSTPSLGDPFFVWAALRNVAVSFAVCRALLLDLVSVRGFTHLGDKVEVDFLEPGSLTPFARKGQRSALVWIGFSFLLSLFWLSDQAGSINALLLTLVLAMVTASFWLPLRGVHRRIADAKQRELAVANGAIRQSRLALETGEGAGSGLADWVAWRGLVQSAREWPFSTPALLRFGLFVVLGLGSWLGGALVERLLEVVLG